MGAEPARGGRGRRGTRVIPDRSCSGNSRRAAKSPSAGLGGGSAGHAAVDWYLVIVGGLAVIATLAASRRLWGLVSDRFGWSLLPVGYLVRPPRGTSSARMTDLSPVRMTSAQGATRKICRVQRRDTRVLAPTTGVEGGGAVTSRPERVAVRYYLALGLADRRAGRLALFAGGVSLFSHDSLHRLWGLSAACAYALAALAVLAGRSRGTRGVDVALGVMLCGAILFPLLWMVAHGNGEPEVGVVAAPPRPSSSTAPRTGARRRWPTPPTRTSTTRTCR